MFSSQFSRFMALVGFRRSYSSAAPSERKPAKCALWTGLDPLESKVMLSAVVATAQPTSSSPPSVYTQNYGIDFRCGDGDDVVTITAREQRSHTVTYTVTDQGISYTANTGVAGDTINLVLGNGMNKVLFSGPGAFDLQILISAGTGSTSLSGDIDSYIYYQGSASTNSTINDATPAQDDLSINHSYYLQGGLNKVTSLGPISLGISGGNTVFNLQGGGSTVWVNGDGIARGAVNGGGNSLYLNGNDDCLLQATLVNDGVGNGWYLNNNINAYQGQLKIIGGTTGYNFLFIGGTAKVNLNFAAGGWNEVHVWDSTSSGVITGTTKGPKYYVSLYTGTGISPSSWSFRQVTSVNPEYINGGYGY